MAALVNHKALRWDPTVGLQDPNIIFYFTAHSHNMPGAATRRRQQKRVESLIEENEEKDRELNELQNENAGVREAVEELRKQIANLTPASFDHEVQSASTPTIGVVSRPDFSKPSFIPPEFNGSGSFREFKSMFEDAIAVNGWRSEISKVKWLRVSLRGAARGVLHTDRDSYSEIMQRLEARYGDHIRRSAIEQQLPTRRRRPGEPLHQLAHHIRSMCDVVYSDLQAETREVMAIKHFGMALNDGQAQYELSRERPATLEEAVQLLQTRESYLSAQQPAASYQCASAQSSTVEDMLGAILRRLSGPQNESHASHPSSRPDAQRPAPPPPKPKRPLICNVCGGNHPIYICRPCRYCNGPHFNRDCSTLNYNRPMAGSSTTGGRH